MENQEFKYDTTNGIITVHSLKALHALDYAVSGAEDAYAALVKDSSIRDAFISFKGITDTCIRVEISVQIDPSDEELKQIYDAEVNNV